MFSKAHGLGLDGAGDVTDNMARLNVDDRRRRPTEDSRVDTYENSGQAGRALVRDVVLPVFERAKDREMDARELEALDMICGGFDKLSRVNPKIAYSSIVDLLLSMNE